MRVLVFGLIASFLFGGASFAAGKRIRVMSYNVENLFDAEHDANKIDYEFLPKMHPEKIQHCDSLASEKQKKTCHSQDWTAARVELKLNQIRKVMDMIPDAYPDILAVIEVENAKVVSKLATKLGYAQFQMTDSPDERGIDVAFLYNEKSHLKFERQVIHQLGNSTGRPTRDILEGIFLVNKGKTKEKLSILVNHWPSQGGPTEARMVAAHAVGEIVKARLNEGYRVIALGDFNVVDYSDQPSPFLHLADPRTGKPLVDLFLHIKKNARALNYDMKLTPPGTYFFGPWGNPVMPPETSWNMLDRFFVDPQLMDQNAPVRIDMLSVKIFAPPAVRTSTSYYDGYLKGSRIVGVPWRYEHNTDQEDKLGFSDHFPIMMDLEVQ